MLLTGDYYQYYYVKKLLILCETDITDLYSCGDNYVLQPSLQHYVMKLVSFCIVFDSLLKLAN